MTKRNRSKRQQPAPAAKTTNGHPENSGGAATTAAAAVVQPPLRWPSDASLQMTPSQHWFDLYERKDGTSTVATTYQSGGAGAGSRRRAQLSNLYDQHAVSSVRQHKIITPASSSLTLKDRVATLAIAIHDDPVHQLGAVDVLLQLCGNSNVRIAGQAVEALHDVFVSALLPPQRKLITWEQRPVIKDHHTRTLVLWYVEDRIKSQYAAFLSCLQRMLQSGDTRTKCATLRTCGQLLSARPEQEATLLSIIVHKLGDPTAQVAAHVPRVLQTVLQQHGAMQTVVAREVQQLLHRNVPRSTLCRGVTVLSQLVLSRHDHALAVSLLQTYFALLDHVMQRDNTKQKLDNDGGGDHHHGRLVSALLTGIRRARPYVPDNHENTTMLATHIDPLYHITHTSSPAAATQALLVLFHYAVPGKAGAAEAHAQEHQPQHRRRFYRALYAMLANGNALFSGKHVTLLFNLLYQAIKADTDEARVVAVVKRLLCTTLHGPAHTLTASLLVMNASQEHHVVLSRVMTDVTVASITGPDATCVLDPSTREPRAALVPLDVVTTTTTHKESCQADHLAPAWEMCLLRHHYHPSVQAFCEQMPGKVTYDGDPLANFTTSTFLDKFAYRNPKKNKEPKAGDVGVGAVAAPPKLPQHVPLNDPAYFDEQDVIRADDVFFHHYFVEQAARNRRKGTDSRPKHDSGEIAVLNDAEGGFVGEQSGRFEDYEAQWESDSDEEAFVDTLVSQIAEDDMLPDELDDEDPDMEDWDDLLYDEDAGSDGDEIVCDDDASESAVDGLHDNHVGADEHEHASRSKRGRDSGSDSEQNWLHDDSASYSSVSISLPNRKRQKDGPVFASAEDFTERIDNSWKELLASSAQVTTK